MGNKPDNFGLEKVYHPAVKDALQFFAAGHLNGTAYSVARYCRSLAYIMANGLEGRQLTKGLEKLREAKDYFVRAAIDSDNGKEEESV